MKAIYREFVASGSVDTQLPGPSSVSFKLDLPRRENPRRFLHNATLSAYSRYSTTGQGNARGGVLALSAGGLYPGDKCGHYLNDRKHPSRHAAERRARDVELSYDAGIGFQAAC